MILSDEASERLRSLRRTKLAEAEATLAEFVRSPVPDGEYKAMRRRIMITRWTNKVEQLRREVGG